MKTLRFFGMALVSVLMCVGFSTCSSDDDDDNNNELVSIITGTAWEQDGDNDIVVVSNDGTGFFYESLQYYQSSVKYGYAFTWTYSGDVVTVKETARYIDGVKYDANETISLRAKSYNKTQIVWQRTSEDGTDIWTWTSLD